MLFTSSAACHADLSRLLGLLPSEDGQGTQFSHKQLVATDRQMRPSLGLAYLELIDQLEFPGIRTNEQEHVYLADGQVFRVQASGWISSGAKGDPATTYNPDGKNKMNAPAGESPSGNEPAPNLRLGSLVGRIGGGLPFQSGTEVVFTAPNSGTLELAFNEASPADNTGAFQVVGLLLVEGMNACPFNSRSNPDR